MFSWLAPKQQIRTKAIEAYLSHFDSGELAYLKNITLTGLRPSSYGGDDTYQNVDISTYIHAEWMAVTEKISDSRSAKARTRSKYRIRLAWDAAPIRNTNLDDYYCLIGPHRLDEPDLDSDAQDRLGAHWTVLTRIYDDPVNAATLYELEEIGEGVGWLPNLM